MKSVSSEITVYAIKNFNNCTAPKAVCKTKSSLRISSTVEVESFMS